MVLGHLLKRLRAFANKTWNKSEQDPIYECGFSRSSHCRPDSFCWICMEGERPGSPLVQRCACPRVVHDKCIARWQLQSAGKKYDPNMAGWPMRLFRHLDDEEKYCRFCKRRLPDWKERLTPSNVVPSRTAVMAVVLNGVEHRITVEPGKSGRKHFEREIRRLFKLSSEDELEFTFDCQAPTEAEGRSQSLQLEGKGAFEAAFHCAAVTAALRAQRKVQDQGTS